MQIRALTETFFAKAIRVRADLFAFSRTNCISFAIYGLPRSPRILLQ